MLALILPLLEQAPAYNAINFGLRADGTYVNGVNAKKGTITSVRTFDFAGLAISTTPGYDNTTGLGVPNGLTFLQRL